MKQFSGRVLLMLHQLSAGGQERQFFFLARNLKQQGIEVAVMVAYSGGTMTQMFEREGISLLELNKKGKKDFIGFFIRMIRMIRTFKPSVIYGGGVVPLFLKPFVKYVPTVWAVRASNMDMAGYNMFFRVHEFLFRKLMFLADAVICNSEAGKKIVLQNGTSPQKVHVVGNGFDTDKFSFSQSKREFFRNKLKIEEGIILVGVVARLDPMKDHETFVHAIQLVLQTKSNVKAVIVGDHQNETGNRIKALVDSLQLTSSFIFTGHESDLTTVYSGLDVLVLSSKTEAFPNVVAEGMLCGLPVVSTRVGDCEAIIGKDGWLIPIQNASVMATTILEAIDALPIWNRAQTRKQITDHYSIETMANKTLKVFEEVVSI